MQASLPQISPPTTTKARPLLQTIAAHAKPHIILDLALALRNSAASLFLTLTFFFCLYQHSAAVRTLTLSLLAALRSICNTFSGLTSMASTSSATSSAADAAALKDKPRLTEQEKKNNHIASEQKRRQAIREGFDRLASLVPGYEGQGRSESLVLQAALQHMEKYMREYYELLDEAKRQGMDTSDLEIPGIPPRDQITVNKGDA